MRRWLIVAAIGIAAIIYTDIKIADRINERILPIVMQYQDRLPPEGLDFDGPLVQGCQLEHIYYFYTYQTCFVLYGSAIPSSASFVYKYHRPVAILAFHGRSQDSYYFRAMELGQWLVQIFEDGTTKYNRLDYEQ